MRTTIDINEKLLAEALEAMGESSKSNAVNAALEYYLRRHRLKKLLELQGKLDLNLDDWYEFRHMER